MLVFILTFLVSTSDALLTIHLQPNTDPIAFAARHRLNYTGRCVLDVCEFSGSMVARDPSIIAMEEQAPRERYKRHVLIADPLINRQWHLNVVGAIAPGGPTGKGITIGIVDDGLQHTHPEIASNYAAHHSYDFNDDDNDPSPGYAEDGHGTSAAAVAAAVKNNGHCGRGVAPEATLAGIRLIAAPVDDMTEAQALSWHSDSIRIYSNSWGPIDNGISMDRPGMAVRRLLALNPHGNIYVWAAGNGRQNHDNCAFDGYAASPYVNAIGAIGAMNNQRSWYSEGCSNLLAVTPSSGTPGYGIVTADLMGAAGYDPTECTQSFGGTSSAAPLAAGIIALLLEKRPSLTWRDVRHIIALGATPVDTDNGSWNLNSAGYRHSNDYGFGLLHIPELMHVLDTYRPVPAKQAQWVSDRIDVERAITRSGIQVVVDSSANITFIESVIVQISLSHSRRGTLTITVTSPEGVTSVLASPRPGDTEANYPSYDGWSFSSLRHWGESHATGNWTVNVLSPVSGGQVHWLVLAVFGH